VQKEEEEKLGKEPGNQHQQNMQSSSQPLRGCNRTYRYKGLTYAHHSPYLPFAVGNIFHLLFLLPKPLGALYIHKSCLPISKSLPCFPSQDPGYQHMCTHSVIQRTTTLLYHLTSSFICNLQPPPPPHPTPQPSLYLFTPS
jgi:hypothetical protein